EARAGRGRSPRPRSTSTRTTSWRPSIRLGSPRASGPRSTSCSTPTTASCAGRARTSAPGTASSCCHPRSCRTPSSNPWRRRSGSPTRSSSSTTTPAHAARCASNDAPRTCSTTRGCRRTRAAGARWPPFPCRRRRRPGRPGRRGEGRSEAQAAVARGGPRPRPGDRGLEVDVPARIHLPKGLQGHVPGPRPGHHEQRPVPPPSRQDEAPRAEADVHVLVRRPVLLPVRPADRDRHLPDVLLPSHGRPRRGHRLRRHAEHPDIGVLRGPGAQPPPMGRPPHGVQRDPAHGPGLLHGGLQAATRVQLGGGRDPAVPDARAVGHRLPAALGPAGDLGHHGRHQPGRVLAVRGQAGQLRARRRRGGGTADAALLVRAPCAGPAVRAGALPVRALLEDPQGRRHFRTALGETTWPDERKRRSTRRPTRGSWPRSRARAETGAWPRAGPALPLSAPTGRPTAKVQPQRPQRPPRLLQQQRRPLPPLQRRPPLLLPRPSPTPNPSKAPWYCLGPQELLRYFHPLVAGVTIPFVIILTGLAAAPFIDRNPSTKPGDRKIAITMFTMLFMFGATL